VNLFDVMCVIPAVILFITAIARLNDVKRQQSSKRWWVRRFGLLLVSVSMVMLVASYFTVGTPYWNQIMRLTGIWGFALTWLTTPGMPPWWKYISKYDPKVE